MSWPMVSLEEISESIVYGINASATNDERGPRFLRITDIHNSSVDWNTVPSCECSEKELEKFRLSSGDIVFARTGATTGKSCLIRNCPTDSVFASYLIRVRLNEKANPEYISHFFQSPTYWAQVRSTAVGAAQPGINATKLKKMQIPLPPIDEQKRIATILDKAYEIKQSSDTIKEMRQQVIRSVFLEMFGDPANPDTQWTRKPFGGLMECKNRIRVPVKKSERETTEGTYPYYGASGIVDYVDDYLFEGEHLLISEDGANLVARVTPIAFIATGLFWVNNHAHVFAENGNLDATYCETLFSLLDLSNHITGSAQPKLNKGNLDKIVIPVPPLEIQIRFRQITENISKIWSQVDERNSALMDNSNSLIQDLIA